MLIHGDCLDVLPTLPDASVQMIFCDLPYGVTANKWDTPIDLARLWSELLRVGKPSAALVFTAMQPFATTLISSQSKIFKYDLVWEKNLASNFASAIYRPLRTHESILIFYRKKTIYNAQKEARKHGRTGKNTQIREGRVASHYALKQSNTVYNYANLVYPGSVLKHASGARCKSIHPTQKPVTLLEWLLKTYTHYGDTVLDPTCGSGTTAIAAINTDRKWVCIEKDAKYHAVAAKRIAEHRTAPRQQPLALQPRL